MNPEGEFAPLYEDEEDDSGRQFLIPNPETMKPPVLSEMGKADFYVVTVGQDVGVFGSK